VQELQALYEQVSELEQLKSDMLRIASHDLKNPVSTIRGYLDLLQLDAEMLSPDHRQYVAVMIRMTDRIQGLIADILTLERFQHGMTFEPIDVRELALRVVQDHQAQAERKSVAIESEIPEEPFPIQADPAQMREAIVNLVSNAIKYTPAGGHVHVKLEKTDSAFVFEVSDTGYGIPEAMQPNLFQPFFRAITDDIREIEGTGLGLHLVKNIVERHGGRFGSTAFTTRLRLRTAVMTVQE
jgi:signal transduction histidine kinase